jgi:lipopolysaccharide transport system ATP-binding protein
VLAVGDAEFQKKCLGKMEDVSKSGRTILFVSHNLPSLKAICKKGVLLDNGKVMQMGEIGDVLGKYTSSRTHSKTLLEGVLHFSKTETLHSLRVNGSEDPVVLVDNSFLVFQFDIVFTKRIAFEFQLHIKKDDVVLCSYSHFVKNESMTYEPGSYTFEYKIVLPDLRSGKYILDICFAEAQVAWFAHNRNDVELMIVNNSHNTFVNDDSYDWWGANLLTGAFSHKKQS